MVSREISNALLRTLFILVAVAAGCYIVYLLSAILTYCICAILLSFIAQPIAKFLQKKLKFSSTLAIISALLFFIIVSIGILLLFVPLIMTQSQKLALLDLDALQKNYHIFVSQINNWLQSYSIDYKKYIDFQKLSKSYNFSFITDILNTIIGSIGNFSMGLFSTFFITFFLMKDQELLLRNLKAVLPKNHRWQILASLLKIKNMLARYAIGLVLQLLVVFILYFIVLLCFGIENALIIAFLGAILNIIPYVGPIIALLMTAFLTVTNGISQDFNSVILPTTLYVCFGYIIVQVIDNNICQPIIASKSTNSHPLEVFIIILISGTLLGITGMIVAIPLYTSIKVILKEFFPKNKFIQVLTAALK